MTLSIAPPETLIVPMGPSGEPWFHLSFKFEQAKSELIWQKERTQEELAEIEAEIRGLEAAIAAKAGPLKVAYSRLELRKERPGIEFCKSKVYLRWRERSVKVI